VFGRFDLAALAQPHPKIFVVVVMAVGFCWAAGSSFVVIFCYGYET
jgi:hypothetical protein